MLVVKIDLCGYRISPLHLGNLASEFYGKEVSVAGAEDVNAVEYAFDGPSAAENAKLFRSILDTCYPMKRADPGQAAA